MNERFVYGKPVYVKGRAYYRVGGYHKKGSRSEVLKLVGQLSPVQSAIYALYFIQGLSQKSIAKRLECSPQYIQQQVKKIEKCLKKSDESQQSGSLL